MKHYFKFAVCSAFDVGHGESGPIMSESIESVHETYDEAKLAYHALKAKEQKAFLRIAGIEEIRLSELDANETFPEL